MSEQNMGQGNTGMETRSVVPLRTGRSGCGGKLSRRGFLVLTGGVAGSALLAACGGNAATETPRPAAAATVLPPTGAASPAASRIAGTQAGGQVLVIEAVEYGFKTMGSIPAGTTLIQFKNLGVEHHEAQFVRLNDGVTFDQFKEAFKQAGDGEPPPIFSFEGGPAQTPPGMTTEVVLNLTVGQYVLLCFVDGPDKQPHAMKGMVLPVTVTAPVGATSPLPDAKGSLTLGGNLGLPATLPAGKSVYRLTNGGQGPRAFAYGQIPPDKTPDDVKRAATDNSGPPPWFAARGGMGGLKPGGTGAVTLDLTPGTYAAADISFGPEPPAVSLFTVR